MSKHAATLAREYDFESAWDYYNYIVESLRNGNRQQVRDLFKAMKTDDKHDFLINHLDPSEGIQKSVLNICITEMT